MIGLDWRQDDDFVGGRQLQPHIMMGDQDGPPWSGQNSMSTKVIAACVALGFYLSLLVLPMFPDCLILFPTTGRIDAGRATRHAIPFQGGELECWRAFSRLAVERGTPDFYILRFYGNADRAERWVALEAEMWNGRAVEVWGMNYPGYGGSSGPARLARIGPAALAAYDELQRLAGDRPIIVFGASLGSAAALHVAAQRPVGGLILHNPPPIKQMILRQFGWWNLWLLAGPWAQRIPSALDSVANARSIKTRAIFLLAESDEVVAPRFQSLVVKAYTGERRVIALRGAGHNSPLPQAALQELHGSLEWLLGGAREQR